MALKLLQAKKSEKGRRSPSAGEFLTQRCEGAESQGCQAAGGSFSGVPAWDIPALLHEKVGRGLAQGDDVPFGEALVGSDLMGNLACAGRTGEGHADLFREAAGQVQILKCAV